MEPRHSNERWAKRRKRKGRNQTVGRKWLRSGIARSGDGGSRTRGGGKGGMSGFQAAAGEAERGPAARKAQVGASFPQRGLPRPPGARASPRVLLASAEKKVDSRPQSRDEQEIPFRLREIMRSRQEMRNPLSNKKRRREGGQRPGSAAVSASLLAVVAVGWEEAGPPGVSRQPGARRLWGTLPRARVRGGLAHARVCSACMHPCSPKNGSGFTAVLLCGQRRGDEQRERAER